jgi:transketolase
MDKLDRNIYCIIGDGESREGQIWEAADFIVDHALTNVVPIFNCNELAQSDWVSPQQSYQGLADKLEPTASSSASSTGTIRTRSTMRSGIARDSKRQSPLAIVARTVKGWGAPDEQGMGKHGTPVKKDKLATILAELDQDGQGSGRRRLQNRRRIENSRGGHNQSPGHEKKVIKIKSFAEGMAAVGWTRTSPPASRSRRAKRMAPRWWRWAKPTSASSASTRT